MTPAVAQYSRNLKKALKDINAGTRDASTPVALGGISMSPLALLIASKAYGGENASECNQLIQGLIDAGARANSAIAIPDQDETPMLLLCLQVCTLD